MAQEQIGHCPHTRIANPSLSGFGMAGGKESFWRGIVNPFYLVNYWLDYTDQTEPLPDAGDEDLPY